MQTEGKKLSPVSKYTLILLGGYALLKGLFIFVSAPKLWGINLLRYLPQPIGFSFTLISLIAIVFSILHQLRSERDKNRKESQKMSEHLNSWYVLLLIILFFGMIFFTVRIPFSFLGDASAYGADLFTFQAHGIMTLERTAVPVLYLLYGIYDLYLHFNHGQQNVLFPFEVISFISGIIFVIAAFRFAINFSESGSMRFLFFMLLISAGGTLFFFSYMELYPLQYSLALVYLYFTFQYLRHKKSLKLVGLILILCIVFHL
jgi:hypothetical protein